MSVTDEEEAWIRSGDDSTFAEWCARPRPTAEQQANAMRYMASLANANPYESAQMGQLLANALPGQRIPVPRSSVLGGILGGLL